MSLPRVTPLQIIVHAGGWLPLALLVYDGANRRLTANPIQAIEQRTGLAALTFLLLSLACTPLASIGGFKNVIARRKALGLYGFLYASLHVLTFFVLDYGLNIALVLADVGTKWYIIIGLTAFLLLLPVAATSFRYWMRRLRHNWTRLHRLVYIISPLVVVHFALSVKADFTRLQGDIVLPLAYGAVIAVLLLARVPRLKHALAMIRMRLARGAKSRGLASRVRGVKPDA